MWAKKSSSDRCASGETSVATISASPPYQHHCRHDDRRAARASVRARRKYMTPTDHGRRELQRRDLEGHVGNVRQIRDSVGSVPDMSDRTTPPFRADHVGSLLRPPALLQAREDFAEGRIDADELREIEDEAIRDVVQLQEDAGLQSATDGEFRRASWHMDFIYQLGGISKSPGQPEREVPQRRRRHRVHARGDAHRRQGHARAADLRATTSSSCRAWSPTATPKLTIP